MHLDFKLTHAKQQQVMNLLKRRSPLSISEVMALLIMVKHLDKGYIAEHAGVSPASVSNFLRGRNSPSTDTYEKYCAALGITPDIPYAFGRGSVTDRYNIINTLN